jgi:hypothetical protein
MKNTIHLATICVVMVAFVLYAQTPGTNRFYPVFTDGMQPSGSDTISWSSGKYSTKRRNGQSVTARGFEVVDTSDGGVLMIHLPNDYDRAGRKCYVPYHLPASGGNTQRVGVFFDEVDSASTTISIKDVIVWY